jgi:two-component system, LuxR family, response regulator FixJ
MGRTMPSESPPSRTVYVVDDDAAFLGSLQRILRAAGLTAVSYQTAAAFLHAAPDLIDGCVLLDVLMPEMDGLELQERLNSLGFNLPVIVMTAKGDVETAVQAMKAGADDFIEKPFDDNLLLDAINAALTRVRGPPLREQMEASGRVAKLSLRERQVLDGLAAGHPTKQIARDLGISARTVEAHRARMLVRLGIRSPAEAVRLAVMAQLAAADPAASATPHQPDGGVSRVLPK